MSTTPASRSSASRMTRHRERRRQGTRCVTVDINGSQVGEPFQALRVTAATTAALSDGTASQGCSCRCVRNSSLTSMEVWPAGSASTHIALSINDFQR